MSSASAVCVECRIVVRDDSFGGFRRCSGCREQMVTCSSRWRAPRKSDERAWALIRSGQWLWDLSAITRASRNASTMPTPLRRHRPRAGRPGISAQQAHWEQLRRGQQRSLIEDELRVAMQIKLEQARARTR